MDRVLSRAIRYQDEKFFRNLVEFALKYDLEDYEKTRAYEGLLVFQCKSNENNSLESPSHRSFFFAFAGQRGDLVAAQSCVESAQKLDVGIGADAMNIYLKAAKRGKEEKAAGIVANIKDFFKGSH